MKFTITFEIQSSGAFGVPEGAKTVLPACAGKLIGAPFHTATMTKVGYGALSQYRNEKDAINIKLNLGKIKANLKDNFIIMELEANTQGEAYNCAILTLDQFLQHLSLSTKRLFSYKPLLIEGEKDKIYPVPKYITISSVTMYNLKHLSYEIENTAKLFQLSDPLLDKSLQYYEHAHFLFENRMKWANFDSRHFKYFIAAAFLNLWKAITTVIGDPSVDSDYQSRYKLLGLDYKFFKLKIEDLRKLRNEYDVAHYNISFKSIDKIEKNFGKAKDITENILLAYRKYLAGGNPSFKKLNEKLNRKRNTN